MSSNVRPALPLTAAEREVVQLRAQLKAAQSPQQAATAESTRAMDNSCESTADLGMIESAMDSHELDRAAKGYQARHPGTSYIAALRAVMAGGR